MNKNENNNKKLDAKELETVSGGELSEEQRKKISEFLKTKNYQPILTVIGYGAPSLPWTNFTAPHINLKEKFEATESPDTPKTDAISQLSGDESSDPKK